METTMPDWAQKLKDRLTEILQNFDLKRQSYSDYLCIETYIDKDNKTALTCQYMLDIQTETAYLEVNQNLFNLKIEKNAKRSQLGTHTETEL